MARTGNKALVRAVALEYLKTFDEKKVAEKFGTDTHVILRVLQREDVQDYLHQRMIPLQDMAEMGARRLMEESLKTALDPDVEWKERTENRKLLARTLLPEFKKISVDHNHYIRTPGKALTAEEWTEQNTPKIVEAEIVDEED